MDDHVWTLRSALEQALVLYQGEYQDAFEKDDEQGQQFWGGHAATVRSVLAEPDPRDATIARLEAELLSSEEHSRDGWATASERCAERDVAQALAESRGRDLDAFVESARRLIDIYDEDDGPVAADTLLRLVREHDAAFRGYSSAAPPAETGAK